MILRRALRLGVAAACFVGTGWGGGPAVAGEAQPAEAGRRIYEDGLLLSGAPLVAKREGGVTLSGKSAACVNCHRRSGMGSIEGGRAIPPVAGPILFSAAIPPRRRMPPDSITIVEQRHLQRPAYDAQSLGRAVRSGVAPGGGAALDYLMPRYALGDADMEALTAYLRGLSASSSPGIEAKTVHFATVITPGVDPARKTAMLEVLGGCFAERTPQVLVPGARTWTLHVWELAGPESAWPAQLAERYRDTPVFAMVSGLGAGSWETVHAFCERTALPCLFANTDLPGAPEAGYESFYFNDGVALEARIAARYLADAGKAKRPRRVVQVFREGDVGAAAASVLAEALAREGIASEARAILAAHRGEALAGVTQDDALVFWLRPEDIAAAMEAHAAPPPARVVLFSGLLAGMESVSLPPAWRRQALLIYPLDAPNRRELRMSFNLHPWLLKHRLPTDADGEVLRGNTLAACKLLDDAIGRMRSHYLRDYLIESIERPMGNAAATSAYPRFSLGVGQRYASKGGYMVRFAQGEGSALVPETDWIVP